MINEPSMIKKKTLCSLAAILVTVLLHAQPEEAGRWSPEFSAKAYLSIFHGSYEITAGARIDDFVFGLGSGYGREYWDAYPAHVQKVPLYVFSRQYIPLGQKRRFLLFAEATLGGEYVYKISGSSQPGLDLKAAPYWNWRASLTPGIALRLFGNTSLYLAPTLEMTSFSSFIPGVTLGVNVGL